jgi:hypothetical protein
MFARYTTEWHVGRALLLLYSAKQHAEVAPGVGKETNMFFIGTQFAFLHDEVFGRLRGIHDRLRETQDQAIESAGAESESYLNLVLQEPAPQQPQAEPRKVAQDAASSISQRPPQRRRKKPRGDLPPELPDTPKR